MSTIPNCGAELYTADLGTGYIYNQNANTFMVFGKHPYLAEGFDITFSYEYSGRQSNFDTNTNNNTATYHIDMQE